MNSLGPKVESVHNTRIERLWRDVYRLVSSSYAEVFTELESVGALHTDNETDIYALHFVFLPRINASLDTFRSAWNNHSLSTESNMSPLQLYTAYSQGSSLFDETIDPSQAVTMQKMKKDELLFLKLISH